MFGSNAMNTNKCKADIEELAETVTFESTLINKRDLLDWSQDTTLEYYQFCLTRGVVPTVDFDQLTVHLKGDKDAVSDRLADFSPFSQTFVLGPRSGETILRSDDGHISRGSTPCSRSRSDLVVRKDPKLRYVGTVFVQEYWRDRRCLHQETRAGARDE